MLVKQEVDRQRTAVPGGLTTHHVIGIHSQLLHFVKRPVFLVLASAGSTAGIKLFLNVFRV